MGIPINKLIPAIYMLGGFIGAAGCMLFAMYFNVAWVQMGQFATTKAWAAASPSGPVTEDAFERISALILHGLQAAMPLDGVYLDLHGAMVTEHLDDGEGELAYDFSVAILDVDL